MSSLVIEGLTKTYQQTVALDAVSFRVEGPVLVGLIGANGAGKSTLFQCVCALLKLDAGTILVDGHRQGSLEARRALGYLPEEPVLWPYLTVIDHLQFIARAYDVADWLPKAEALLERLHLADKRSELGGGLSQGMRRKVALAMALLHDSSVLLLDEPFNGLDPEAQHELRLILSEVRAQGVLTVMSSHRLSELEEIADSFVVLSDGRVVGTGNLDELRDVAGLDDAADLHQTYLQLKA